MSTATVGRDTRSVTVPPGTMEKMGLLLRAKAAASEGLNRLMATPRRAWGWLVRTLHLEAVSENAKAAANWAKSKASGLAQFMGTNGMIGAGLLMVSTENGRSLAGLMLRPLGWALRLFGKVWSGTQSFAGDHLGSPGRWVANRMADIGRVVVGDGDDLGLTGKAAGLWLKYVTPYTHLNGLPMMSARLVGTLLVAPKVLALVALLPLGFLAAPAAYLTTTVISIASIIMGMDVFLSAKAKFSKDKRPRKLVLAEENDGSVHIASSAVTTQSGKVSDATEHDTIPPTAEPTNRAEKRAAGKRSGNRH